MKILLKIAILGMVLLNMAGCGNSEREINKADTVKKLQTFSTVERSDKKYCFNYNDEWKLTYITENEFVTFKEDTVINCFESYLGEGCLANIGASAGGFSYDLDENEIRIYCDVEFEEGNLTIINYNLGKKEFILRVGKYDYESSDEFLNWVDDYDLVAIMEKDIERFVNQLEENEISIGDVTNLRYEDVKKYME